MSALRDVFGHASALVDPLVRVAALGRRSYANAGEDLASYRVLVASLFSSPTTLFFSNFIGTLVPFFCWHLTGRADVLALAVLTALISFCRGWTVFRYYKADHARDGLGEVWRWDREFVIGATGLALVLGLNSFVTIATTNSIPSQILTIICGVAYSAAYVARNAGRPHFVFVQLLCIAVPTSAGLAVAEQPYYGVLAVFLLLYTGANVSITLSLHRNLLALAAADRESSSLAEMLRRKNATLDTALNTMGHGLAMFDAKLRLEVANSRFAELFSLPSHAAVPGKAFSAILSDIVATQTLAPDPARDLETLCRRVSDTGEAGVAEVQTERNQTFVVSVQPAPDSGILMLTEDATSRKATAAQIEHMAHHDALTGLPNRFFLTERLKDACTQLALPDCRRFSIFCVDLDHFKTINDSLGHEAGDQLLIEVAGRLRQVVNPSDLLARFGGDEFVLLSGATDADAALELGRRMMQALSPPFNLAGSSAYCAGSIGIALAPEHGTEPADVLRAADMALYAAKAAGRSTVVMFDPDMAADVSKRRELEQDLRDACEKGYLLLHYQPVVDLATGRPIACEALMRWMHPEKGLIPPVEFIPVAEQTGLISRMGEWALRRACTDAARWPQELAVAVNISAVQFKDPERLVEAVKDALLISRLAPNRLELEVTESLLIEDQEATLKAIRALRRIGVRFSLDDFGTGYSSLAYLARYPFSKVKIDRTFARHVTTDNPSRSIIEGVCQLARRLGLQVVVEGIETDDQRVEVRRLGAEQAQGYLFGRPQAVEQLRFSEQKAA